MKKLISALLSMALILGLIPFGALNASADPVTATSDQKTWQVEDDGGHTDIAFHTGSGSNIFTYEDIQIFKTIEPVIKDGTPVENYFDITLKLSSPPHTHAHSTNVVLVMDISNTMNYEHDGSEPESGEQSRLDEAIEAATAFATTFCNNATNGATHKLGIVTFNTNATKFMPLTLAKNTDSSKTTFTNKIGEITAPATPDGNRFTNIEGGLQLAYNMLEANDVTGQKYIILLTDGFPTTYIKDADKTSTDSLNGYRPLKNSDTDPRDTVFHDHVLNLECYEGTNYSEEGAIRAQNVAAAIKADADKYKIFSIGLDIGGQSIRNYLESDADARSKGKGNFSTIDRPSTADGTYAIEIDPPAGKIDYTRTQQTTGYSVKYGNWLAHVISTPAETKNNKDYLFFWHADNTEGHKLSNIFPAIIDEMVSYTSAPFRAATVIDPMGTNIEFIGMFDKDGTLKKPVATANNLDNVKLVGVYGDMKANPPAGENDASFNYAAKTVEGVNYTNGYIEWDPVNSGWYRDGTHTDGRPIYSMSLKYRVRLKNEAPGFVEDNAPSDNNYSEPTNEKPYPTNLTAKDHETNGTTTFTFTDNDHDEKTEKFPIPVIEGYLGELEFTKFNASDSNNSPMSGVEFTLTHKGSDCSVCKAAGNTVTIASASVTSGADGKVKFENIPSGHDYTLEETVVPVGYKKSPKRDVTVSYNTVTVSPAITDGKISNEKLEPIDVILQVEKLLDGNLIGNTNKEFKFQLSTTPTFEPENILQTVANDNSGAVKFAPIKFGPDLLDASNNKLADYQVTSQPQNFVFYIREVLDIGADTWHEDILYDENIIKATVTIDVDYANNEYTQTVAYTDYDTPANVADNFANTSRPGVSLKFSPKKFMDNTVKSGYKFGLYKDLALTDPALDANGDPIEVTSNSIGLADIVIPEITASGTYTYYLAEIFEVPSSVSEAAHKTVFDPTVYKIEFEVKCPRDNENSFYIYQSKAVVTVYDRNDTSKSIGDPSEIDLVYSTQNGVDVYTAKIANELELPFNNLTRQPVTIPLFITKTMDGKAAKGGQFSFILEDLTDSANPVQYTAKNADNGNIIFTAADGTTVVFPDNFREYNNPTPYGKPYHYRVYETDQTNEKLVYDYSVYDVKIDISAPNEIGLASYVAKVSVEKSSSLRPNVIIDSWSYYISKSLNPDPTASPKYITHITDKDGNPVSERNTLTFANKTREPASVYFSARKTLNFHKPGENDVFNFILIDATSGNDVEIREKTNDGYGVDFGSISYNRSGKYTYKVYERSGNDEKITYDKSLYTIVVDVTVDITSDAPFKAHTTLYRNGELHTDDNVPTFKNFKYDIPNTGDISNIALYGIIAAISGIALIVIVRKKRRNSDN